MLNKANITWSAKQVAKMVEGGKAVFNNIIQRSYVWEITRKSELIHSMIEGYPIPPFYAKKVDGKVYDFLDGKQRMSAIVGYLNGEYALTGISPIEYENEEGEVEYVDINGKLFSELPEEFQDLIKDYSLTIYYYENISPEQTRILFKKLNNGKPLSAKERNIANTVDIETVSDIANHSFFTKTLTEKGLSSRKQWPIIMKLYLMISQDLKNISFESKDFNEVLSTAYIGETDKEKIIKVLDKAEAAYDILTENKDKAKTKLASETHLVSLAPFLLEAAENDISDNLVADFVSSTFGGAVVVSEEYTDAASKGSAKTGSILTRNAELETAWEHFFKEDETDEVEDLPFC